MKKIKRNGNLVQHFNDDGKLQEIWSYYTCLFCRDNVDGTPILNITRYSVTTSKQMSRYVYKALRDDGIGDNYVRVNNMRMGCDVNDLRRESREVE